MDLTKYDNRTNELIEDIYRKKQTMDETIFDDFNVLMETAQSQKDSVLLGFVHYHLADSIYAFEVDYDKFRYHMSRAISYLVLSDEEELLTRAYNYLGIDALNNGAFDIAYYHYMNALNVCEPLGNTYLLCIVNNNIGQVYARMKNHQKALEYVRMSNDLQLKSPKDDVYYYQNTISGFFSEGVLNIFLGNYERAREIERYITELEKESGLSGLTNTVIPVSLLRLQLALIEKDDEQIEEYLRMTTEIISDAHRLFDFLTDIRDICEFLITNDYLEIVRTIMDAITKTILNSNVPRMRQHLYAIEIAYCEKLGKKEDLTRILLEKHHAELEQEEEQNRIRHTSMELIDTMNFLRKQSRMLEVQAQTDTLTGIPNRLRMERDLNEGFEKAFAAGTRFAIEILDIDSFKDYNDFYGHPEGDACLQKIAKAISGLAAEESFNYARYGGDEFVLIFEGKTDEDIIRIAEKLDKSIYDLNITHEKATKSDRISVSQGICNDIPRDRIKPWEFFSMADKALYSAKGSHNPTDGDSKSICLVNLT